MAAITKKSTIGEVLNMNIETARSLWKSACTASAARHLRARASRRPSAVHGVDCDELIEKLNEHLAAKKA